MTASHFMSNTQYFDDDVDPSGILQYCNADGCINSSNDLCTSCRNLVRFGLVSAEFMRLNCVYQSSVSTQDSLTTFARGQQCLIVFIGMLMAADVCF